MPREELWTGGALVVDGPAVPLRRFRKSHHFIRASFGGAKDCNLQRRVNISACRPAVCVATTVS
jgi:hypothetical protein